MSEPSIRPNASYRPDIDGLRAVAVLAVLVFHLRASALPGGFLGVDVFFVISGYVVTGSLLGQRGLGFWRLIGEFYAKRFARILPALCAVLLASALGATLLVPQSWLSELSDKTGLYAYLGLSNWVMQSNADTYFAPRAEFNPYTHTWSLGVEEQFYLLAPLLIYAFMRWG
ncbi:MAG: acyltransferase [Curvibacter lanceolatus]|jgi:peptidoglycan/LPS O-acetylase OafA/YrhL|nr:acyltransferase [Curvibacter lanceolatus]